MVNYIGKTNLYKEVLENISYSYIPKCKDSIYRKFKGMEVLTIILSPDKGDTILVIEALRASYGLRIRVNDADTNEVLSSTFYKK